MITAIEHTSDLARAECVKLRAELARAAEAVTAPHQVQLLIAAAKQYAGGVGNDLPAEIDCPACEAESQRQAVAVSGSADDARPVASEEPDCSAWLEPDSALGRKFAYGSELTRLWHMAASCSSLTESLLEIVDEFFNRTGSPTDDNGAVGIAAILRHIHELAGTIADGLDHHENGAGQARVRPFLEAQQPSGDPTTDESSQCEAVIDIAQAELGETESPAARFAPGEDLGRVGAILGAIDLPAPGDPVYGTVADCARTCIEDAVFLWEQTADIESLARACRILHDGQPGGTCDDSGDELRLDVPLSVSRPERGNG